MIQDVKSAFSPDQSVSSFCSNATRCFAYADSLLRPVCESSSWTSEDAHETSHNRWYIVIRAPLCPAHRGQRTCRSSVAPFGFQMWHFPTDSSLYRADAEFHYYARRARKGCRACSGVSRLGRGATAPQTRDTKILNCRWSISETVL